MIMNASHVCGTRNTMQNLQLTFKWIFTSKANKQMD
jgi:hypothetical protein